MDGASGYESVVEHEAYRRVNRLLVQRAPINNDSVVVDLGGGTGAIAELALLRAPRAEVWVIDPDERMLADAERHLGRRARYALGCAEDIGSHFREATVDVVAMGNVIHLIDDIEGTVASIRAVLVDGGTLAFNTAFFEGADAPSERHLYWEAALAARKVLRARGLQSARITRSLAKRPLTETFYVNALDAAGFLVKGVHLDNVALDRSMILDIVGAPVFAEAALPGVDPAVAAEIMAEAADSVMRRREVATMTRTWMTVVARSREADLRSNK